MAVQLRASVVGTKELQRKLKKMNPEANKAIMVDSLGELALLIQQDVRNNQLPFGTAKARFNSLTSRSGTLRKGIQINRGPLPRAIEVRAEGKAKVYAPLHEFGLGRHRKRTFMQPALEKIAPKFGDVVLKHWKKQAGL
jgi:hypothetical protein